MSYQAFVCETVTGRNLGPIDVTVKSWSRLLNGSDTGSVQLSPGALTVKTRDQLRLYTTPERMTLVIEWSNAFERVGTPVFAGPIAGRPWDKGVTINAASIRTILERRKLINPTAPFASQRLTWQNMSLGSIAVKIVQFATSGVGGALPIVYPAIQVDSDPTHLRNYDGFNLKTANSAITDLTNVINGPDIDFTPVWADSARSAITYQMRVGTNEEPRLFGPNQVVFDATQPKSSVKKLTYMDDGSALATRQWGAGSGTDVNALMSMASNAALIAAGFPALEQQKDYKSEILQSTLDVSVQGDLEATSTLLEQWGLNVDGTSAPVLGSYLPGDLARVNVRNHIWIPDGDHPMRIIGISGDGTPTVKLNVQGA